MNKATKTTKGNLPAKVGVLLMVVMVLLSAIAPMKASAHSTYLLTVTVNEADNRYEPMILYDREGWGQNHAAHRESKLAYFGEYDYVKTKLPDTKNGSATEVGKALEEYDGRDYVKGGISNPFYIYSFPGFHGTDDFDATAKDLARAEWVSRTMVQSLNDAIAFITQEANQKPDKYQLMFLGTKLANTGYHGGSFKYGDVTVTVKAEATVPASEKVQGVNKDGYAKITLSGVDGEKSRYFVTKVPKGYKENQPLYSSIPQNLKDKMADGENFAEDVRSLTWKHAVLQAHHSFGQGDISYDNFDAISKPNKMEQMFTEAGENFLLMLRTMLGLHSFSELMLNEGTRGSDAGYFLGIMPMSWLDSANILHWTSMALSWLLIMFAFARLLAMRNLAAINIAKRVDLVDGIKNLVVVGFALMLFNPIFYALANFNWLLVDVMKNTSDVTSSFGTTAPGAGLLAKLFISFAYLIMEVYFNFIYISRGIIVAILYGVGPLFIASLAFGGKYVQIFSNYAKELIGSIYMQTFHAILLAFFATVTIFGGVRLFEQLVVLFAFIPLTKFFREAIGVGGGLADIAGAGAFGAVGDMAKMGTKSMRQSTSNFKSGVSSKPTGGGAPTTSMKSASSFQSGTTGTGSSMTQVDNGGSMASLNAKGDVVNGNNEAVKFNALGNMKSPGNSNGGSMTGVDNSFGGGASKALAVGLMGASLKASAGAVGIGGAVGMSAVGAGGVAQNLAQTAPKPQRSFSSTKNGMYDQAKKPQQNRKQKAPSEVFENSGYADSAISPDHSKVQHRFRVQDEEGANGLYDDYGIKNVREDGAEMVYEYDFDTNTNSFNAGTHSGGQKALLMQDMYKTFNSDSSSPEILARKAAYESQGITGVRKTENGLEVSAKRGTGGIQGAGRTGDHYHFTKRNGDNGSINLLDAIEYADGN